MKHLLRSITGSALLFVAAFFAVGWPVSMLLWMFILGDSHESVWRILPYAFAAISAALAITFLIKDLAGKTTRRGQTVRLTFSVIVCAIVLAIAIHGEASRIKGWSSEKAALSVATALYPESTDNMTLREDSRTDVPAIGRGPNIEYTVMSGTDPLCRVAVCRRYWSWWTCGMYETLKERK